MEILDLGCGRNKLKNAFGVDFVKLSGVDFVWDLNKQLPKKFHIHFSGIEFSDKGDRYHYQENVSGYCSGH